MSDDRRMNIRLAVSGGASKLGADPVTHVDVTTWHHGGKGYTVCAQPITVGQGVVSFWAFSGVRDMRERAPRFNRKRLQALQEVAATELMQREGLAWSLLSRVLLAEGLTLVEEGE